MTKKISCEECRRGLPIHLLGIMPNLSHVCSCGAAYKDKDGVFIRTGNQRNPVAEYDEAEKKKEKAEKKKEKAEKKKPCRCIDAINKMLAEKNHQLVLAFTPTGLALPVIATEKVPGAPRRDRSVIMAATFCPFCGKKYPQ